ncbi:MAG: GNAT family N-acetyltransferase [Pseudomonadota bacterium]
MNWMSPIIFRRAEIADLPAIIGLLCQDELGSNRESQGTSSYPLYEKAFKQISKDPNQYLLVAENNDAIVGTCHLTFMPSLTFKGSMRMNIEAVRVHADWRGKGLGEKMLQHAVNMAKERECKIVQLATNKQRHLAQSFYEKLGFQATHVGMKLCLDENNM